MKIIETINYSWNFSFHENDCYSISYWHVLYGFPLFKCIAVVFSHGVRCGSFYVPFDEFK